MSARRVSFLYDTLCHRVQTTRCCNKGELLPILPRLSREAQHANGKTIRQLSITEKAQNPMTGLPSYVFGLSVELFFQTTINYLTIYLRGH